MVSKETARPWPSWLQFYPTSPKRQGIAITGSVNQLCQFPAMGGAHDKIEGFYRSCVKLGGLSETQGVVIPRANEKNRVLRDEVAAAVAAGSLHIWSVTNVNGAVAVFTVLDTGQPDGNGQ